MSPWEPAMLRPGNRIRQPIRSWHSIMLGSRLAVNSQEGWHQEPDLPPIPASRNAQHISGHWTGGTQEKMRPSPVHRFLAIFHFNQINYEDSTLEKLLQHQSLLSTPLFSREKSLNTPTLSVRPFVRSSVRPSPTEQKCQKQHIVIHRSYTF